MGGLATRDYHDGTPSHGSFIQFYMLSGCFEIKLIAYYMKEHHVILFGEGLSFNYMWPDLGKPTSVTIDISKNTDLTY